MIILGLDMATKTGWAVHRGDGIESGVQDFTKRRGESNGVLFLRFRAWLFEMRSLLDGVGVVYYERAHFRGGAATELLVGMQTHLMSFCAEFGVECVPVHTGELKKAACGRGTATKGEMIAAARKILGREPIDDNEADAVHLAMLGVTQVGERKMPWE